MPYNTEYHLEVTPENNALYHRFLSETGFVEEVQTKWYEYREDCKTMSRTNPGYLIVVTGHGEENGDIWREAFLDGEMVWEWTLDANIPEVPQTIKQQDQSSPCETQKQ